ncbi:MAG: NAD(P)H-hydrate dehydratase [Rhodoferax sp.]|nr:NAD(P)H-hydrate dehydratase [Rhodoferax sp.]
MRLPQRFRVGSRHPVFLVQQTRMLERYASSQFPPNSLMERAGHSVGQLALALRPHATSIWVACGAGNNGGDGLWAAAWLRRTGKAATATWLGQPDQCGTDVRQALAEAVDAGVPIQPTPPPQFDVCIDALLGIGGRPSIMSGPLARCISIINASGATVVSIDLPSGLSADTGQSAPVAVRADHTISMLTLKPGYFMGSGRDLTGTLWFDPLGCESILSSEKPKAWMSESPPVRERRHASHKGQFGNVAIVGGSTGMQGAALLAGTAALYAGTGRVFIGLLGHESPAAFQGVDSAIMIRQPDQIALENAVVVCGCGGGSEIARHLPRFLKNSSPVVIDADGLNAIASDSVLGQMVQRRGTLGQETIMTPHPLEAARLLKRSVAEIQADRLTAATTLSQRFDCVVVLKGSGSVIASPDHPIRINPTGNGRLATAGSGDVLAGLIGAELAKGTPAFDAACHACFRHGATADSWDGNRPLTADLLSRAN